MDKSGQVWTTNEQIGNSLKQYFSSLFTSSNLSWQSIDQAIRFVELRVTQHMNQLLDVEFKREEIKRVVFDISALKALGPDGF